MQERLKKEIRNIKLNENETVFDYINDDKTDLSLSKHLIFRKAVEFGNQTVFDVLVDKECVDIDACNGKALIEAVRWNREEMIIKLLSSEKVNPKSRTFQAYRIALLKCSDDVINLFEKRIHETELKHHEKLDIIKSFIISNNYSRFLESIEEYEPITKKQYLDLLHLIVTRYDVKFLKFFIEKNKELNIVNLGKIYQLLRKKHNKSDHIKLVLSHMKEQDFGYGNECIVRNMVKEGNYAEFKRVLELYDFDFSLFNNKILKEALKRKVDMNFLKAIISHKSLNKLINQKWYDENKELILSYPNNYIIRNYIDKQKFEYF